MEIALVISSLAGAATAATINKFPKNKNKMPLLGATTQIRAQIDSLKIEKDILAKTITRLYQNDSGLTQIQRDKLLSKYQYQLGTILSKIEKLEDASKYPDLGPLGDGLMSLMDQKLSALDKRLAEISSKMTVVQTEKIETKKEEPRKEIKTETVVEKPEITTSNVEEIIKSFAKPATRLELTTLTEIPTKPTFEIPVPKPSQTIQEVIPQVQTRQEVIEPVIEIIPPQTEQIPFITQPIDIEKQVKSEPPKLEFKEESRSEPERKKPKINIPEPEVDDDEDDLDSIKREIMKTLSKLEQAEVE
jgi:hypothetical protein